MIFIIDEVLFWLFRNVQELSRYSLEIKKTFKNHDKYGKNISNNWRVSYITSIFSIRIQTVKILGKFWH